MIASKRKGPGMATSSDLWYIRLPDGRVLHARSTNALRRYLKRGRLPWDIRVRRSPESRWQTLERTPEFADLLRTPEPEASPPPPEEANTPTLGSRTIGVHVVVEELFSALDSALQRTKLMTAALTGLGVGITVLSGIVMSPWLGDWAWAGSLATGLVLLVLFSICTSILTQMTSLEMSRYRPITFSEARVGLFGFVLRLTCALAFIGGLMLGMIVLFRALPGWLTLVAPNETGLGWEILLNVIDGARWLLEVICWPIGALAVLLMGPIMIVEDCSIWQGLREWLHLLRRHLARIYLYQAFAFAFAAMMTLPLLLPIVLMGNRPLPLGEAVAYCVLIGVAVTPGLAYLTVAHAFIYLNLRYEFFYSARER